MVTTLSMIPLDLRYIDDEAVDTTIYIALSYAVREESVQFCLKYNDHLHSWEGYCDLRSDLERVFNTNRNLQRVIYNVAVRHYIDFCYNTAMQNLNPANGC